MLYKIFSYLSSFYYGGEDSQIKNEKNTENLVETKLDIINIIDDKEIIEYKHFIVDEKEVYFKNFKQKQNKRTKNKKNKRTKNKK